jgi:hypothetical protein
MSIDQVGAEALKLPPHERAMLAASLWASLEDPYELASNLTDDAALALAETRDRQMESGEVVPLGHAELMKKLRK